MTIAEMGDTGVHEAGVDESTRPSGVPAPLEISGFLGTVASVSVDSATTAATGLALDEASRFGLAGASIAGPTSSLQRERGRIHGTICTYESTRLAMLL